MRVLGRQPFQTVENKPIHVQAKNMLPRPCNLYRNLGYERGAPVHIYGKIVVFCQASKKNGLTRTIEASFHEIEFCVPFKSSFISLVLEWSRPFVPKVILWGTPKASQAAPIDPRAPRPSPGRHRTDKTRHFRHMRPHFFHSVGNLSPEVHPGPATSGEARDAPSAGRKAGGLDFEARCKSAY